MVGAGRQLGVDLVLDLLFTAPSDHGVDGPITAPVLKIRICEPLRPQNLLVVRPESIKAQVLPGASIDGVRSRITIRLGWTHASGPMCARAFFV